MLLPEDGSNARNLSNPKRKKNLLILLVEFICQVVMEANWTSAGDLFSSN